MQRGRAAPIIDKYLVKLALASLTCRLMGLHAIRRGLCRKRPRFFSTAAVTRDEVYISLPWTLSPQVKEDPQLNLNLIKIQRGAQAKSPAARSSKHVVISTATGVPASRYESFAEYLLHACPSIGSVYLWDYPGVGTNRFIAGEDMLLSEHVDLAMWAESLSCVLHHASNDSDSQSAIPVIPIGHSNGSLLLPWALRINQARGNQIDIPRVISIAAQNPTICLNTGWQQVYLRFVVVNLLQLMTQYYGYLPLRILGMGTAKVPPNIARDWLWRATAHRDYISSLSPDVEKAFAEFDRFPVLATYFTDDAFLENKTDCEKGFMGDRIVDSHSQMGPGQKRTEVYYWEVSPASQNVQRIGHVGWSNPALQGSDVWCRLCEFVESGNLPGGVTSEDSAALERRWRDICAAG
jgi:predicted alpha/beta hydrolase